MENETSVSITNLNTKHETKRKIQRKQQGVEEREGENYLYTEREE